jgi:hypothetical protein
VYRASITLLALVAATASRAQNADAPPPSVVLTSPATSPAAGADTGTAPGIVLSASARAPAPQPAAGPEGTGSAVSPEVAAAVSAGMPKYSPPAPVLNQPKDLRDVDKPKNEIPRLPSYLVRAPRPSVFRDRDLYTSGGLLSLSYKLHPGLLFGNVFGLNAGPAYDLYQDDQRLANIADLADTAHAISTGGDKAESEYIIQETQDTYMRPAQDWTWGGPGGGISGDGVK